MATPYSGNPGNYPTSAALPDDGDAPTAELFNVPYEALFDRTANLNSRADAVDGSLPLLVPDVQTFDGNGTWTKPDGAVFIDVLCVGGGGGGGGSSGTTGGGGGGAGERVRQSFPAGMVPPTVTILRGSGGNGGTTGNGVPGSTSFFGDLFMATGGLGGVAGSGTVGGSGGKSGFNADAALGGAGGNGADNAGDGETRRGASGGGGGGDGFQGALGGGLNGGTGGTNAASPGTPGKGYGAGGEGGSGTTSGGGGGGGGGYGGSVIEADPANRNHGRSGAEGLIVVTTWRTA